MAEIFELSWDASRERPEVVAFRGAERLSTPFEFDVYASIPSDALPTSTDALGTSATLSMAPDPAAAPHYVSGIVAGYRIVQPSDERTIVELKLVPRLWRLGQVRHSRVFTRQSIPDVVRAVLELAAFADGQDFELRLDGSYPEQEHVCQYKESDLAFISRWLEHEGMYYFFEHTDSADKLIITDHHSFHELLPPAPIRYYPRSGEQAARGDFSSFVSRRSLQPDLIRVVDYDYAHPDLDVSGEATVSELVTATVVEHGARCWTPDEGNRLATLRAEQRRAQGAVFDAAGAAYHLRPGFRFELSEHPREALNRGYLCTELSQRGSLRAATDEIRLLLGLQANEVYHVETSAIESDLQYRHALVSTKPTIAGFERGTVDGPADSEYAQLDDDGRYHVKMSFDEGELAGGNASVAIRMMQPHGGNPEGFHFPLRKGTEVLIAFVAGDPDRPVIAGSVPNAETPAPITSDNGTRNMIRTGGGNELEIEDDDGNQWCDWRSPTEDTYLHLGKPYNPTHHIVKHTNKDCKFDFGTDQKILVGGKLTEEVKKAVTENYDTSQTSQITGDQTTVVFKDVIESYAGGQKTEVTKAVNELYLSSQTSDVTAGRAERYEAAQTTIVPGGVTQTYNAGQDLTVHGPSVQLYAGPKKTTVTAKGEHLFDQPVTQVFGPTKEIMPSTTWNVPGGTTMTTSSWNLLGGQATDQMGNVTQVSAVVFKRTNIALAFIADKYEATGAAAGMTGLKLEATGVTGEAYLVKIDGKGIILDTKGASVENASAQHD